MPATYNTLQYGYYFCNQQWKLAKLLIKISRPLHRTISNNTTVPMCCCNRLKSTYFNNESYSQMNFQIRLLSQTSSLHIRQPKGLTDKHENKGI